MACAVALPRSQAELEFRRHEASHASNLQLVRVCRDAVEARWRKYNDLFDSVSTTVSHKFMAYMYRRGHQVGGGWLNGVRVDGLRLGRAALRRQQHGEASRQVHAQ